MLFSKLLNNFFNSYIFSSNDRYYESKIILFYRRKNITIYYNTSHSLEKLTHYNSKLWACIPNDYEYISYFQQSCHISFIINSYISIASKNKK